MKVLRFRIRNYRAIKDTLIELNYSINPIIGVNESGKTTLLHAILAFDKNRDRTNSGKHLEYQNKYSTIDTKDSKITAYIVFEKNELNGLRSSLELKTGTKDYDLFQKLNGKSEFVLTRALSDSDLNYFLEENEFTDKTKDKIKKYIQNNLPYILYFDDFTDRVPDEITFKEEYKSSGKLSYSKSKEWQEIIVEIFRRAKAEGIDNSENPLKYFFNLTKKDRKDDILSDIEDVLNKEIIAEWKRIKQSGHKNFADDSENLSVVLQYDAQMFTFKVKDTSSETKKRTFNISERSKGFQWFFNYMIKIKFNPRYNIKQENSIFLLDEPGSYLHSSAQSELLQELKNVSKKNTIIYCTHSQYLLNPKTIKLGSIKIAEKFKSNITLTEYGHYKSKDDKGALSAVYQALNLNFTKDFVGKTVVTEGVTDMYFFNLLKKFTDLFKNDFTIIAGSGSGNSSNLISIGLSFSENFIVLFDNDQGAKAIKKYESEFGKDINRHFHLYSTRPNFRLEDFLSSDDNVKLLELTNTGDLKRAFALLYYEIGDDKQKEFICNLTSDTIQSLTRTIEKINNL